MKDCIENKKINTALDDGLTCCYRKETFVNATESLVGYGETIQEAYENLIEKETKQWHPQHNEPLSF